MRRLLGVQVDPDLGGTEAALRRDWLAAGWVAVGGAAGSLARAGCATLLPHAVGTWPWWTIGVNVVGSGLLSFLLVVLSVGEDPARIPRLLVGTGLLGGFTTFSTFALDAVSLAHAGRPLLACLYVVATLLGTLTAAITAMSAARSLLAAMPQGRRRSPRSDGSTR